MERVDQHFFVELLQDTLARGEAALFHVKGGSMLPWLRDGQKVRVIPFRGEEVRRGDIVLFWRSPGEPVLHRVVRVRSGETPVVLECRGDAEHGQPEEVPIGRVLGRIPLTAWERLVHRVIHPPRRAFNRWAVRWRQRRGGGE